MNNKNTTQELSRKALQAHAMRLNATNAETLRDDEITTMVREFPRTIVAMSAGLAGITGAIVKLGDQPFYAANRNSALFALLQ